MTSRRVVLYTATLAYVAACAAILHTQNRRDYRTGWHDPVERQLTWHEFPRCLP